MTRFGLIKEPRQQQPPTVSDEEWPATSIDRFILANLEQAGIEPAQDAEAYRVLRRLCFDLIGLPPTLQQVEYFEAKWQSSPEQAITHVVDQPVEIRTIW